MQLIVAILVDSIILIYKIIYNISYFSYNIIVFIIYYLLFYFIFYFLFFIIFIIIIIIILLFLLFYTLTFSFLLFSFLFSFSVHFYYFFYFIRHTDIYSAHLIQLPCRRTGVPYCICSRHLWSREARQMSFLGSAPWLVWRSAFCFFWRNDIPL